MASSAYQSTFSSGITDGAAKYESSVTLQSVPDCLLDWQNVSLICKMFLEQGFDVTNS